MSSLEEILRIRRRKIETGDKTIQRKISIGMQRRRFDEAEKRQIWCDVLATSRNKRDPAIRDGQILSGISAEDGVTTRRRGYEYAQVSKGVGRGKCEEGGHFVLEDLIGA